MTNDFVSTKTRVARAGVVKVIGVLIIAIAAWFLGYGFKSLIVSIKSNTASLCKGVSETKMATCLSNEKLIAEIARLEREKHLEMRPAFWGAAATIVATLLGAFMLYVNGYFDAKLASLRVERANVENIRKEIAREQAHLDTLQAERDDLAAELVEGKLRRAQEDIKAFFARGEHDVDLLWRLCSRRQGMILDSLSRCGPDAKKEEQLALMMRLNSVFVPIIMEHELTSSMMIVDSEGLEYVLLHERDFLDGQEEEFKPYEWRNRIMRKDHWGQRVLENYWGDARAQKSKGEKWIRNLSARLGYLRPEGREGQQYDPRDRMYASPWLRPRDRGAGDRLWRTVEDSEKGMYWTPPYFFYTTKAAGITVSKGWRGENGDNRRYVLAVDITVTEISQATIRLGVGKREKVFVFTEDGRVMGLPAHERFDAEDPNTIREFFESLMKKSGGPISDQEALLPKLKDVGDQLNLSAIGVAFDKWEESRKAGHSPNGRRVSFMVEGKAWEGRFEPYEYPQSNRSIWVGVIAPSYELGG